MFINMLQMITDDRLEKIDNLIRNSLNEEAMPFKVCRAMSA